MVVAEMPAVLLLNPKVWWIDIYKSLKGVLDMY